MAGNAPHNQNMSKTNSAASSNPVPATRQSTRITRAQGGRVVKLAAVGEILEATAQKRKPTNVDIPPEESSNLAANPRAPPPKRKRAGVSLSF